MKPIKRGMTEAVTRDGRKVTQLTWFDVETGACIFGILDGEVHNWYEKGSYWKSEDESRNDIFAPVEYEWQWLVKDYITGRFNITHEFYKNEFDVNNSILKCFTIHSRIEESKREVKS